MNILKSLISIKRPEAGKQYTEPTPLICARGLCNGICQGQEKQL